MPETKDFVRTWKPDPNQHRYSPGWAGENGARQYFWGAYQAELLKDLQAEINSGWRPVTVVGPEAFTLRSWQVFEPSCSEMIGWVLTFGFLFLMDLVTGSCNRTWYAPTEFRVTLQKNGTA